MALYYNLPVFKDICQLILMLFECSKDILREYKHTLEQDMKRKAIHLVKSIYRNTDSKDKELRLVLLL